MQSRTEDKWTGAIVRGRRRRARAGLGDGELSQQALEGDVEAVTGDGDLVTDVSAGGRAFRHQGGGPARQSACDEAEQRAEEVDKQMSQRKALNESRRCWRSATTTSPTSAQGAAQASSFDRVVEDTLKAQIKR